MNYAYRIMNHFEKLYGIFREARFGIVPVEERLSINETTRTIDGKLIYYPKEKPTESELVLEIGLGGVFQATYRYTNVWFTIYPIIEEDLQNGKYKFHLLLKTSNGILLSEPKIEHTGKNMDIPSVSYDVFCPFDSGGKLGEEGELYLPLNPKEISELEIMLSDKIVLPTS
jgi:hypothetical protein